MAFIDDNGRARISEAINRAEGNTSGEIVALVAGRSDDYAYVPFLWASLAALAVPLPALWMPGLSLAVVYLVQLCVFIIVVLVLKLPSVLKHVVPAGLKRRRSHRHALEQFLAQDMHTTSARTGVLIFVSVFERYCEVIADEGIYEKVDAQVWREAVNAITTAVRSDRTAEGFVTAIDLCGDVLAKHFPEDPTAEDVLPNHLIEI